MSFPFRVGQTIGQRFAVETRQRRHRNSDQKPFIVGNLRYGDNTIPYLADESADTGHLFSSFSDVWNALAPGRVVEIQGQIKNHYQGGIEVLVRRIEDVPNDEIDPTEFLPKSPCDIQKLRVQLEGLIGQLSDPWQRVVRLVLGEIGDKYETWPAAKDMHHAYVHGLLEHSIEVVRIARAIATIYTLADQNLLIAGGLLHDIGKLEDYQVGAAIERSTSGRLLGHVLTGYYRVRRACESAGLGEEQTNRLLHLVASHHGRLEWGATSEPQTVEAIILHHADILSAQLHEARQAITAATDGAEWTDRAAGLDRPIFVGKTKSAPSRETAGGIFSVTT